MNHVCIPPFASLKKNYHWYANKPGFVNVDYLSPHRLIHPFGGGEEIHYLRSAQLKPSKNYNDSLKFFRWNNTLDN